MGQPRQAGDRGVDQAGQQGEDEQELDGGDDHSAEALYANVTSSLEKAISAGELSPRDQSLVKEMWDTLFQKATQQ